MRVFAWIIGVALAVLLAAGAGGFFVLKDQFKAPPNGLALSAGGAETGFVWLSAQAGGAVEPHSALLVPVRFEGSPKTVYLQFDLGAPYTLLYAEKLASLKARVPGLAPVVVDGRTYAGDVRLHLGNGVISAAKMRVRAGFSRPGIDWDHDSVEVVGTLGADAIDRHVAVIDYPRQRLILGDAVPAAYGAPPMSPFDFTERRVVLHGALDGAPVKVMFDTGSSAFAWLTDKDAWGRMRRPGAPETHYATNSWDQPLVAHNAPTRSAVMLGGARIDLGQVSYIEGTSPMQDLLMRFSGMGGMTGNRLFLDRVLILDARRGLYAVEAEPGGA